MMISWHGIVGKHISIHVGLGIATALHLTSAESRAQWATQAWWQMAQTRTWYAKGDHRFWVPFSVPVYNTQECGYDGRYCDEFSMFYPNCTIDIPRFIGNGRCKSDSITSHWSLLTARPERLLLWNEHEERAVGKRIVHNSLFPVSRLLSLYLRRPSQSNLINQVLGASSKILTMIGT